MFESTHHACSGGSRRAVTCRETRNSQCLPTASAFAGGASRLVVMAALVVCLCWPGLRRSQAAGNPTAASVPAAAESAVPEGNQGGGHEDPVTPLLLGIGIVLLAAKAGGDLMVRIKQPAVLGALLVGVVLGNAVMLGFDGFEFLRLAALLLAAGITVAAIVGKQVCSLGVLGHGLDRMSVEIGMIPQGEVGLIFAASGQTLVTGGRPVIDAGVYTTIVVMVMITTLITPPLLGWSLRRHRPSTTVAPHQEL